VFLTNHRAFHPWLKGLLASACFLLTIANTQAEVVVVTNKASPDMTKEQVSDVFMGKATSLPGGAAAVPIDLPESSPLRDEFYSKLTGKSAAQVKSYWAKMSFTGKGIPPKEAASSADVKKAVAATPGTIGYVEKSAVDSSIKPVLTLN
jgi:ABC-type phosphate transport system substrate-binding protein